MDNDNDNDNDNDKGNAGTSADSTSDVLADIDAESGVTGDSQFQRQVSDDPEIKKLLSAVSANDMDINSWEELLRKARDQPPPVSRDIYERILGAFPLSGAIWVEYAEMEYNAGNIDAVKDLFKRTLNTCWSVELWKFYLRFVRDTKLQLRSIRTEAARQSAREEMAKAFEAALSSVGFSAQSQPIWMDYLEFLKEASEATQFEAGQKATALRRVYQRAVVVPMKDLEQLWGEYREFEQTESESAAEDALNEVHRAHLDAAQVHKERQAFWEGLENSQEFHDKSLPRPFDGSNRAMSRLNQWKTALAYERRNPERVSLADLKKRVRFAYHQALRELRFYPEIWCDLAKFEATTGDDAAQETVLRTALEAMPRSALLHFSLADAMERDGKIEDARRVHERLVEEQPSPTAFIQYQRFAQRTQGARTAREIFRRARGYAREALQKAVDSYLARGQNGEAAGNGRAGQEEEKEKTQDRKSKKRKNNGIDSGSSSSSSSSSSDSDNDNDMGNDSDNNNNDKVKGTQLSKSHTSKKRKHKKSEESPLERISNLKAALKSDTSASRYANEYATVYIAAAQLEFRANKNIEAARNIFELAIRQYPDNVQVVMEYVHLLSHLNHDGTSREVFERILSTLDTDRALPVWKAYLDFETLHASDGGDIRAMENLEQRISDTYPSHPELRGLLGSSRRYSFMNVRPSSSDIDRSFFRRYSDLLSTSTFGNPAGSTGFYSASASGYDGQTPSVRGSFDGGSRSKSRDRGGQSRSTSRSRSMAHDSSNKTPIPSFLSDFMEALPSRVEGLAPDANYVLRRLRGFELPPRPTPSGLANPRRGIRGTKRKHSEAGAKNAPKDVFKKRLVEKS